MATTDDEAPGSPSAPGVPEPLHDAWARHVGGDPERLRRAVERQRGDGRRHHGVEHVAAVVGHVVDLAGHEPVGDLGAVVAAAVYHDAVYDPRSASNEHDSARLAERELAAEGWPADRRAAVATMIEATAGHEAPGGADASVLLDADLAVLGSTPERYDAYAAAVREEYAHVADDAWRRGRRDVLTTFLGRESIFATATARSRWEDAARSNLERELRSLDDT